MTRFLTWFQGLALKSLYFLRAPCAQTNPPSKPSWRQRPFCQSCSSPTCCEEAQKAKQRKQKVCSSQTLQREGANCLCAWYRSQPPGSAGFPISSSRLNIECCIFEHCPQEHNVVLIRCGRLQDVPNVSTKCIRGKYDLPHVVKKS